MNYKNCKGSVSPFLIIVMTALLLLIFALIDIFRICESKNHLHTCGMIAVNSCMCDYNRELKNDYDLFAFVYQNKFEIEEEIKNNLKKNLNGFGINKIELKDVYISDYINLENKNELINQIKNNYFKNKKDEAIGNIFKEIFFNEEKIDEIENSKINPCSEDEYDLISNYIEKDNREEIKNRIVKNDNEDIIIYDEMINEIEIDDVKFETSKNESKKLINNIENKIKFKFNDECFIDDYIFDKFDYLTKNNLSQKEKVFDAEIEFILCGQKSQNKNIQGVKDKILLILYPEKLIEIYNDDEKKMEAELIAQAVCGWWASEIGVTITKNAILSAWALDNANDDYEKIKNGENVHINLLNIDASYKDMLKLFLLIQNEDEKIENLIKIININMKKYNYNFSMKTSYAKIKVNLKANEKFIFMTRKCIPSSFRFTNEIEINEVISYGY